LDGLSKEPWVNATMVAEKAMVDTFGDVLPPFADDGVYRHVRKFALMLLLAKFEPHHELFVAEPLPGESAEDHADRLESVAEECCDALFPEEGEQLVADCPHLQCISLSLRLTR
jgi:hypothetical protein